MNYLKWLLLHRKILLVFDDEVEELIRITPGICLATRYKIGWKVEIL